MLVIRSSISFCERFYKHQNALMHSENEECTEGFDKLILAIESPVGDNFY